MATMSERRELAATWISTGRAIRSSFKQRWIARAVG